MKKRTDHPFEYEGDLLKRYPRATRQYLDTEFAATSNERSAERDRQHCKAMRAAAGQDEWVLAR